MPYNQQGQWVGGGGGGSLEAEESVKRGLGGAYGLIGSPQPINYPGYVPSQGTGPTQQNYIGYTPNQPMAQIQTPNYQLGFGGNYAPQNQYNGYQQGQGGPTSGSSISNLTGYQQGQGESTGRAVIDSGYQREQGDAPSFGGIQRPPWAGGGAPPPLTGGGMQTNQGNLPNPLLPPEWNSWNPASPPQYQQVNPNVSSAPFNWGDTPLGMERVQNPYTRFNPAGGDPTYQKMGNAPAYEGLMGGDYDAFQKALQTPGEIEAKRAYEQGQINLANQMGGKGLYGSSIMANQARTALEQPYMDTLAKNAASAAATRYGQQAADLQNKNQFGLNIYGQQMNENQAANQMGFNTWDKRLGENLAGQGYGLEAQKANQGTYAALQGLLSGQGLARNQAGLDYVQMQTDVSGQNANRALQQATALNALRSGDFQQYNNLMSQQNLARNTFAGNTYGQQLGQLQNMNQFNLSAAQLGMTQNQNLYQSGVADAARRQDYNLAQMEDQRQQQEAIRQWQNQQRLEQFQYQLASGQYANNQNTAQINQYLALAGLGAPLAQTQMNNQTNSQNAWIGALGGLLGNWLS